MSWRDRIQRLGCDVVPEPKLFDAVMADLRAVCQKHGVSLGAVEDGPHMIIVKGGRVSGRMVGCFERIDADGNVE
jgi:hypothetical protein